MTNQQSLEEALADWQQREPQFTSYATDDERISAMDRWLAEGEALRERHCAAVEAHEEAQHRKMRGSSLARRLERRQRRHRVSVEWEALSGYLGSLESDMSGLLEAVETLSEQVAWLQHDITLGRRWVRRLQRLLTEQGEEEAAASNGEQSPGRKS